jgi:hypothetical protein
MVCVFLFYPANIRNIITIHGRGENYFCGVIARAAKVSA